MSLQKLMKDHIDSLCTRKILVNQLKKCSNFVESNDKEYFIKAALYFDSLYEYECLPIEYDAITYSDSILKTIEIFDKYITLIGCDTIKIARDVIQMKVDYIGNVKSLAG